MHRLPGVQGLAVSVCGGDVGNCTHCHSHKGGSGANLVGVHLARPHKVITTSSRRGKMMDDVLYLATNAVNLIPSK